MDRNDNKNPSYWERELQADKNDLDTDELDMCFDIAFSIDEHLRLYNDGYREKYPEFVAQQVKEAIAKAMMQSKTAVIKSLLTDTPHEESKSLLESLKAYEKAYPKNHVEIYKLKPEYQKQYPIVITKQFGTEKYVNSDMYELMSSFPLKENMKPKRIELSELILDCFTQNRYVPRQSDVVVINYNGNEKAYFREMKDYVELMGFSGEDIISENIEETDIDEEQDEGMTMGGM